MNWNWTDLIGYLAVPMTIATFSMRTMIPLRTVALTSNVVFIVSGLLGQSYITLVMHALLLPLNAYRLHQMLQLVNKVKRASRGDLSMDWLQHFMKRRRCRKGEILFQKGDEAQELFYTLNGHFRLRESGIDIPTGQVVGELGLLSPDNRRTQTLECAGDGEVLTVTYRDIMQLYFQNPTFGLYLLQLSTGRLFQNVAFLEQEVERLRKLIPPEATAAATAGVAAQAPQESVAARADRPDRPTVEVEATTGQAVPAAPASR